MDIYRIKANDPSFPHPSFPLSICLGSFDGMHLGHRRIFLEAQKEGEFGALLFDPFPDYFLEKRREVLTSTQDQIRLLSSCGAAAVYLLSFDESLLKMEAASYEREVLFKLQAKRLVYGEDFTYGYKALGNAERLRNLYPSIVLPLYQMEGQKVSSSLIRSNLADGNIEEANRLLGRPYEINGKVAKGFGNGHKIGYPTANMELAAPYFLPKEGVYGALCYSRGKPYVSIVNVGKNPTVGKLTSPKVECHLLGLNDDIYDETIYTAFYFRLRDEKKFPSLEELSKQLKLDEEETRERFLSL